MKITYALILSLLCLTETMAQDFKASEDLDFAQVEYVEAAENLDRFEDRLWTRLLRKDQIKNN
ncbi:MAG: hypothetical protein PF479_02240 [Oceanispirochaeta sp.]|jgi:hypothetical protein|nr:hypothetical protein [Oceanispirochaeta sp.]